MRRTIQERKNSGWERVGRERAEMEAEITRRRRREWELERKLRDLILELNEHHTIRELHIDVVEAIRAGNRVIDAVQEVKP